MLNFTGIRINLEREKVIIIKTCRLFFLRPTAVKNILKSFIVTSFEEGDFLLFFFPYFISLLSSSSF